MMARRRNKPLMTPEERAEYERRYDETTRLLEERIAYHRARVEEERERREREEVRRRELAELGFVRRMMRRLAA
jgi:hypothetical protein